MSQYGLITESEKVQLVEKWHKHGFKMDKISSTERQKNTAMVLENQYKALMEAGSTLSGDIADFKKIIMPLVRRIFPTLIANDLVAVQPMSGPVGLAYALRFRYKTTFGGATAGDEMGYNTIHQGYTGAGTTPASASTGTPTVSGEHLSSVDPTAIRDMSEAGLELSKTTITAVTRKLKARFSLEAQQDLKAMHGVDIEKELINTMQYEIAAEIDRELINRMYGLCTTGNGNLTTYNAASTGGDSDGRWRMEDYRNMYTQMLNESQKIATATRRGAGNFIVATPNVITALESISNFVLAPTNSSPMNLAPAIAKVGSIPGRFDVYRDTLAPASNTHALIGYKGPTYADAGIVYSPYIPVMMSTAVEPGAFYPVIGMMTRYAVTDALFGAANYYRKINFTNLGLTN